MIRLAVRCAPEQADFVLLQLDLAKTRCEQLGFKNPDSDTILGAAIEEFEVDASAFKKVAPPKTEHDWVVVLEKAK